MPRKDDIMYADVSFCTHGILWMTFKNDCVFTLKTKEL